MVQIVVSGTGILALDEALLVSKANGGLTPAAADPPPLALRRAAELFR